jgi:hypothetical protein
MKEKENYITCHRAQLFEKKYKITVKKGHNITARLQSRGLKWYGHVM